MKCPNCLNEISNEAAFCGYCGTPVVKQPEPSPVQPSIPPVPVTTYEEEPVVAPVIISPEPVTAPDTNSPEFVEAVVTDSIPIQTPLAYPENTPSPIEAATDETVITKQKKKRTGLKLLLIFSITAIVAGAVLGFLIARGTIDLSGILQFNRFEWSDMPTNTSSPDSETDNTKKEDGKNVDTLEDDGFTVTSPDGEIIINGSLVEEVSVFEDTVNNSVGVLLKFNDTGKERFAQATQNNVGYSLSININGESVSAPVVNGAITDGKVFITCTDSDKAEELCNLITNSIN